jgi:hypothetical protein
MSQFGMTTSLSRSADVPMFDWARRSSVDTTQAGIILSVDTGRFHGRPARWLPER